MTTNTTHDATCCDYIRPPAVVKSRFILDGIRYTFYPHHGWYDWETGTPIDQLDGAETSLKHDLYAAFGNPCAAPVPEADRCKLCNSAPATGTLEFDEGDDVETCEACHDAAVFHNGAIVNP